MGRRARVSREQVLSAAREGFLERGFDGTTLADISARLGISPAALLRHAPTKQALFTAAMGATPGPEMMPLSFLESVESSADPARVLRQVAHALVPFIQAKLRENLGRWVHARTVGGRTRIPLPFDPAVRPTPPQKNLNFLADYFRRARRAGTMRVKSPVAAAFAFVASLQSFVILQEVIPVLDRPMPLETYLETLIDIWKRGALGGAGKKR